MANTLLLKKSGTASDTPTAGELSYGELAINYADGKLFFKNSSDNVEEFSVNDWDTGVFSGHVLIGSTDDSNHLLHVDGAIGLSNNIHFASGGEITWAHGDASIVEGASSNYAIDFYNYDGSGNNLTLSLNPDHSATFAGQVNVDSAMQIKDSGATCGGIYTEETVLGTGTSRDISIFAEGTTNGGDIHFMTGGSGYHTLTLDASNNATFLGNVTLPTAGVLSIGSHTIKNHGNDLTLESAGDDINFVGSWLRIKETDGGGVSSGFRPTGELTLGADAQNTYMLKVVSGNSYFGGELLVDNKRTNLRLDSTQTAPNKLATVLMIKGYDGGTGDKYSGIGFNYGSSGDVQPPAWIGIQGMSGAGHSKADIVFATRSVTTDTAPTERMRITTDGNATFGGDVTITGQLNITGDIDSYSVTDLDVVDKTITVGAGQIEANSGGSGIVVDGSGASMLWNESSDRFDFNKNVKVTGTLETSASAYIGDNLQMTGGQFYINGGSSTDGAWRMYKSGTSLLFGRRESGSWADNRLIMTADGDATFAGDVISLADNSKDLGSSSKSWANLYAVLIKDGSLGFGNGFWKNDNVVAHDFTVPSGEIWKSFDDINVNTGVNVTVNGTWTLTSGNFGET